MSRIWDRKGQICSKKFYSVAINVFYLIKTRNCRKNEEIPKKKVFQNFSGKFSLFGPILGQKRSNLLQTLLFGRRTCFLSDYSPKMPKQSSKVPKTNLRFLFQEHSPARPLYKARRTGWKVATSSRRVIRRYIPTEKIDRYTYMFIVI